MNPLDLRGPQFLAFYLAYGLAALALVALASRLLARSSRLGQAASRWFPGWFPPEGDAYAIALLRGGPAELVDTLLCRLACAGLIALDGGKLTIAPAGAGAAPPNLSPLESAALAAVAGGAGRSGVQLQIKEQIAALQSDLGSQGWSGRPARRDRSCCWAPSPWRRSPGWEW